MTVYRMSDKELQRLDTIKRLHDGALTRAQASELLGISIRQVQRLSTRYRHEGVEGLVSRKRGNRSNRSYPDSFKEYVLHTVRSNYADFGPTLACEKLREFHDLHVSVETLRIWMTVGEIWQLRKQRNARVHQPRNRRECFGELVQIDGSDHYWFEDRGPRCTLLVFIDDATGRLMELRFVPSESTFDYFYSVRRYLERHGKPVAFYSDKHSVFRVNKQGATGGTGMTQFGRALHELNIDIICANTSQAKGRVERANRTLQDRLVKELRLRGIDTVEVGNQFLESFQDDFNTRFGRVPTNCKDLHRTLAKHECLEDILTWQEERTVTKNLTIQYDRVVYLLEPTEFSLELKRKKVRIYDYPDGTIDIRYEGLSLPYRIFDKARQIKQADIVSNKRLGTILQLIQEQQAEKTTLQRSQAAPKRRGQKQLAQARKLNPAVL
jgi:hypothetical protein